MLRYWGCDFVPKYLEQTDGRGWGGFTQRLTYTKVALDPIFTLRQSLLDLGLDGT